MNGIVGDQLDLVSNKRGARRIGTRRTRIGRETGDGITDAVGWSLYIASLSVKTGIGVHTKHGLTRCLGGERKTNSLLC